MFVYILRTGEKHEASTICSVHISHETAVEYALANGLINKDLCWRDDVCWKNDYDYVAIDKLELQDSKLLDHLRLTLQAMEAAEQMCQNIDMAKVHSLMDILDVDENKAKEILSENT